MTKEPRKAGLLNLGLKLIPRAAGEYVEENESGDYYRIGPDGELFSMTGACAPGLLPDADKMEWQPDKQGAVWEQFARWCESHPEAREFIPVTQWEMDARRHMPTGTALRRGAVLTSAQARDKEPQSDRSYDIGTVNQHVTFHPWQTDAEPELDIRDWFASSGEIKAAAREMMVLARMLLHPEVIAEYTPRVEF